MPFRIKRIQVKGIRGLVEFDLTLDSKSLVVTGENGSGKSSLVDALEFFFTGKIAHLEGIQGISFARHGCHVEVDTSKVEVTLTFDPGLITVTRTSAALLPVPPVLAAYFDHAKENVYILRRSQILQFIDSQPADRFRAIGSIVGIESLDNLEKYFLHIRDKYKAELESLSLDLTRALGKVQISTGYIATNSQNCLDALNQFLTIQKVTNVASMQEAVQLSEQLLSGLKKDESPNELRSLQSISRFGQTVAVFGNILELGTDLSKKVEVLIARNANRSLSVETILREGEISINNAGVNQCPLCESFIDTAQVLASIKTRRATLQALSEEAALMRQAADLLKLQATGLIMRVGEVAPEVKSIPAFAAEVEPLRGIENGFNRIAKDIEASKDLTSQFDLKELQRLWTGLNSIAELLSKRATQMIEVLEPSKEDRRVLAIDRAVQDVKTEMEQASIAENALIQVRKKYAVASATYQAFSQTKKDEIEIIYTKIQAEVERYYGRLHPDEDHKNIQLGISQTKRASTELTIDSFGKTSEDPRAFCSEGHLDSLGLCIFLAFVKEFNKGFPLIVLDDVVTTVDSSHRGRICEILYEEFPDDQLLITTHDRIWSSQLRAEQLRFGVQGSFLNFEFVNWTLENGPNVLPIKSRLEDVDESLRRGDLKSAGNKGRQFAEWLLLEICVRTRAPLAIPLSRTLQYEHEELLSGAQQRLKKLIADPVKSKSIEVAFLTLQANKAWGNLLSHNNVLAEELTSAEVEAFIVSITAIRDQVSCQNCKNLLDYDKEMRELICKGKKCTERTRYITN